MKQQLRITERLDGVTIRFPANGMPWLSLQGRAFQVFFWITCLLPMVASILDVDAAMTVPLVLATCAMGFLAWKARKVRLHLSSTVLTLSTPSLRKSISLEDIDSVKAVKDRGMGLFYLSIRQGASAIPVESLLKEKDASWAVMTLNAAIRARKDVLKDREESPAAAPPEALLALVSSAQLQSRS